MPQRIWIGLGRNERRKERKKKRGKRIKEKKKVVVRFYIDTLGLEIAVPQGTSKGLGRTFKRERICLWRKVSKVCKKEKMIAARSYINALKYLILPRPSVFVWGWAAHISEKNKRHIICL